MHLQHLPKPLLYTHGTWYVDNPLPNILHISLYSHTIQVPALIGMYGDIRTIFFC